MSKLAWYWHRLRAMSPAEMALHARKKWRQRADAGRLPDWSALNLEPAVAFPRLPKPEDAPPILREALRRDADDILAGHWKAFGHLDLKVDDPPKWHCDYLVGKDLATTESAFKLNHRALPGGSDAKLIWELSRWYQLVRLAMAAYVLGDARAATKCVEWLEDWVKHNPPYRGWNWTSALEAGMRLVQFTWIDALLSDLRFTICDLRGRSLPDRLNELRRSILPAHVWFTWRHKSFGSSANNHLLGELAGLIVATVRWPALAGCGAAVEDLQELWSREVLAQFAPDGGNREQALNYQLFSWELCWQAFDALQANSRNHGQLADRHGLISDRLSRAARFFWEAQARTDHWDYGDSDNAFVVPFFARTESAVAEWHRWFEAPMHSPAIAYWIDDLPANQQPLRRGAPVHTCSVGEWWVFEASGIGICESGFWWLRWDLSPLGHLATAAHGHLDALHLSIWRKGVALVVDPGTGAYYADPALRAWLASRAAHNGPCPAGPEQPRRLGPFLWAEHHAPPSVAQEGTKTVGVLPLTGQLLRRSIEPLPAGAGWRVEDECLGKDGGRIDFTVRWQFAPGTCVKRLDARRFLLKRREIEMEIEVGEGWADVFLCEMDAASPDATGSDYEGIVSPAFRQTARAPFLKLSARAAGNSGGFTTVFRAV